MEDKKVVQNKSEDFGVRIIKLYKHLTANNKEYVLFKQILRSGTSIGANVFEAERAISGKDFLAKMYIALKECEETQYWLRLLYRTDYINDVEFKSIYDDCIELSALLTSIIKTKTKNLEK